MTKEEHVKSIVAYRAGREARKAKVVVGDNPYDENSSLHWDWMRGWTDEAMTEVKKGGW